MNFYDFGKFKVNMDLVTRFTYSVSESHLILYFSERDFISCYCTLEEYNGLVKDLI